MRMVSIVDKLIIYKSGETYFLPIGFTNYGQLIEINGEILKSGNSPMTTTKVESIRMVSRKEIPHMYINGSNSLTPEAYSRRIEYLQRTFKEQIDEKYDDDGMKQRVCIWKDKDKELEHYILVNHYTCVNKPVFVYGDYLDFEIVELPQSPNKYITADWKTSDKLVSTATINKTLLIKDLCEMYVGNKTLKIDDYTNNSYHSSSSYIRINGNNYYINSGTYKGTLDECVNIENTIRKDFKKWITLELSKLKNKELTNCTSVLIDVEYILSQITKVQSKVSTKDNYVRGINRLKELKDKLEKELIENE